MRASICEIKAICGAPENIRAVLNRHGAHFAGKDHQVDTYFNVATGRLKLRQGNIENTLIFYRRPDEPGPKLSTVLLYETTPNASLKSLLEASLGVLTTVDKIREIYFIGNVKFHIDEVKGLGSFVEIEAIDTTGAKDEQALLSQCTEYMDALGIDKCDLVTHSYSDMILRNVPV